jgi:hypothetical protein
VISPVETASFKVFPSPEKRGSRKLGIKVWVLIPTSGKARASLKGIYNNANMRPQLMTSTPQTGKPSVARFVPVIIILGFILASDLETGKLVSRTGELQRAIHPNLYWTGIGFEIAMLMGLIGYFLYTYVTRR